MNKALTQKQQRVYSFVRNFFDENDYAPTLSEIATAVNVSAINTVVKYLNALQTKGYISRSKHAKRGIVLINNQSVSPTIQVPVKASVGCDDLSVIADEKYDEFLEIGRAHV